MNEKLLKKMKNLKFALFFVNDWVSREENFKRALKVFSLLTLAPVIWLLISCYTELNFYSLVYFIFGFSINTFIELFFILAINRFFIGVYRFFLFSFILILLVLNFRYNVICLISFDFSAKILIIFFFFFVSFVSFVFKSGLRFALLFSFFLVCQSAISLFKNSSDAAPDNYAGISLSKENGAIVKRNVYFIGLDSLPDVGYYRKYFNDDPFWFDLFGKNGFRGIYDARTGGASTTRNFYLNIFSFSDQQHYLQSRDLLSRPSKFYYLLQNEGYKSQFMFHSYWLGSGKNKFFNYNYPTNEISDTTCPFLTPNVGYYLCQKKVVQFVDFIRSRIAGEEVNLDQSSDTTPVDVAIERMIPILMSRIKIAATDNVPWVSVFHLWEPGHTTSDYRHDNEIKRREFKFDFHNRARNAAKDALNIVAEIKKYDRNPIIIISGDHGPRLSEGWEVDQSIRDLFSFEERIEDTQGIGLFVYPNDFCKNKIKDGYVSYLLFNDVFDCMRKEGG